MIYIKVHSTENGDMVAMCDSKLIGKILREGEIEINIKDYSEFYKGVLVDSERAANMLDPKRVYSANIIGKESVDAAIKAGIVHDDGVKMVSKIPYAHTFQIKY